MSWKLTDPDAPRRAVSLKVSENELDSIDKAAKGAGQKRQGYVRLLISSNLKLTALAALLAAGPASAQLKPLAPLPPSELKPQAPLTFNRSLESLERNLVITPRERRQLQTGSTMDVPAFQQACRSGALSTAECSSGVVKRRRGSRLRPRVVLEGSQETFTEMPSSPAGTTYNAPDSEQKRRIREQIEQRRRAEQLEADRRAEAARLARLKREEELRQRYRQIGGCTYDWNSWGKSRTGVRSVKASKCSGVTEVAVDCSNFTISKLNLSKWRAWKVPSTEFEDLVVESCANVLGAIKPIYSAPVPSENERAIEASTTQQSESASTTTPPPPPLIVAPGGSTNSMPPGMIMPSRVNSSLEQRYRDAIRAQQEWLQRLESR